MTTRWSAVPSISLIRWLETSTARPSAASDRSSPRIQPMPSGSRPLTGSSKSSTGGSPSSAAAMPSRCAMPSEKPPVRRRATLVEADELEHLVDAACAAGRCWPRARAGGRARAGPGWRGAGVEQRADLAQRARELGVAAARRRAHSPASGASRPRISRIVVDLPAPFGPTKPVTRPGRTVNDSPSTASVAP